MRITEKIDLFVLHPMPTFFNKEDWLWPANGLLFSDILLVLMMMLYQWLRRNPDAMPVHNVSWVDAHVFRMNV